MHADAAARMYEIHLAKEPDDVSARLNLALAYGSIGHYDRADEQVRKVIDRPDPGLTPYGFAVSKGGLSYGALGRGDLPGAMKLFEEYVHETNCGGSRVLSSHILVAIARTKDIDRFNATVAEMARFEPTVVRTMAPDIELLRIILKVWAGREDEALKHARRYPQKLPAAAVAFWKKMPDGEAIINTWNKLRKDQ
jgi:hypothetical protein